MKAYYYRHGEGKESHKGKDLKVVASGENQCGEKWNKEYAFYFKIFYAIQLFSKLSAFISGHYNDVLFFQIFYHEHVSYNAKYFILNDLHSIYPIGKIKGNPRLDTS